jgi:outer membrane protein assembly factor BamB
MERLAGMPRDIIWVATLIVFLSGLSRAAEGEWSRFRGPNGCGISDATTVPVTWTDADYNWKIQLPGRGHSSPVLWQNRLFVTAGDPTTAQRTVLCLDATDGRVLWRRDCPSRTYGQHRDSCYATATPAVDAHGVVVTWTTPEAVLLLALDLEGREVWRRDLGPFIAVNGSGTSPIIFENSVVLANDQEDPSLIPGRRKDPPEPIGKSFVIAVDRGTGQTRWELARPTLFSSYATPCVHRPAQGPPELIFANSAYGITAVDPATGKVNWQVNEKLLDRCVGSPVIAAGLVIATCGTGTRGSRFIAARPGGGDSGSLPQVAYEVTKAIPLVPTSLAKDGRLFTLADDGILSCLQASTGQVLWRERLGGAFYASPVCVNDRLYCVAKSGDVVVVAAADKFAVLARVPLGEPSYATPAVAGGVMYLRTQSHLFSLGGRKR